MKPNSSERAKRCATRLSAPRYQKGCVRERFLYREVARHESAHAAAGVLLGHLPTTIKVGGVGRTVGFVQFPFRLSERNAADQLQVVLAGWIADEQEPPRWPIDLGVGGDYALVAALAEWLDLGESGYRALVTETWKLSARPEFGRLESAFCTALEYRSRLDRDLILDLVFIALDPDRIAEIFLKPTKEYARVA